MAEFTEGVFVVFDEDNNFWFLLTQMCEDAEMENGIGVNAENDG